MVADKVKAVSLAELTDKNLCSDVCKHDKALKDEMAELKLRLDIAYKEFVRCTSQSLFKFWKKVEVRNLVVFLGNKVAMGKSLEKAKFELNNRRAMVRKAAPRDVLRIVENQIIEKASIICTTLSSCISTRMEEFFAT